MIEKKFRCPNCKEIATYSVIPGNSVVLTCPFCGSKGKVTLPESNDEVVIEVSHLKKLYGPIAAVNDISFSIRKGEIFAFVGPNGSGKTTTIKLLCGLLHPTSGSARVLGRAIPCKVVMREIGYMPQEIAVYLDNTVHENLLLFGEIYDLPKERIKEREQEMLDFVGLSDRRDAIVSTLSGGMRHRVSLACALIHEPQLLFLDEPTVGVDPELRETFWGYFKAIAATGITVVITTHYMDEANHCSRVGFLRQGKLIAEGEPFTLKNMTGTETLEDAFLALCRGDKV